MDAIDQIFAEFELVYHNQYNKAYANQEKLHYAKKLWFSHLSDYSAETLLKAANQVIRESEFLPTVRSLLKHCETSLQALGLPTVRQAYIEACQAPSPKTGYDWSHPAVYWAGHDSDWFYLASHTERQALPVFEGHYRRYCRLVQHGESLSAPTPPALAPPATKPLELEEQREKLAQLRRDTGI
jgi:hypothetical protein